MKIGDIIKINFKGKHYKVKVVKVLEMFSNGNGFVRVLFPNGKERDIAIWK